jgi:HSP20 family protein
MAMERWRPFGTVERWQPFRGLSDIQSEMNRMFDTVFGHPAVSGSGERLWAPLCDMWETKEDLVVSFELPGVSEKDVNVSITGDLLTVRGERQWQEQAKNDNYHRLERMYGKFERSVQLPFPVQANKVKATYRDGVLVVTLPKAEEVKPREIKIDIL